MRESDEKLCFREKERGIVWKDYMEKIMNEEIDGDHSVKRDAAEGAVIPISRDEVV